MTLNRLFRAQLGESVEPGILQKALALDPSLMEVHRARGMVLEFTSNLEKNSGVNARLLWSESDENLAQKLIARLQRVQ